MRILPLLVCLALLPLGVQAIPKPPKPPKPPKANNSALLQQQQQKKKLLLLQQQKSSQLLLLQQARPEASPSGVTRIQPTGNYTVLRNDSTLPASAPVPAQGLLGEPILPGR